MKHSGIREQAFKQPLTSPDSAVLHPGYKYSLALWTDSKIYGKGTNNCKTPTA